MSPITVGFPIHYMIWHRNKVIHSFISFSVSCFHFILLFLWRVTHNTGQLKDLSSMVTSLYRFCQKTLQTTSRPGDLEYWMQRYDYLAHSHALRIYDWRNKFCFLEEVIFFSLVLGIMLLIPIVILTQNQPYIISFSNCWFASLSLPRRSQLCSIYSSLDGPTVTRAQILRKYSTCWPLYSRLSNKPEMVSLFFSAGE